jgi:hypothetical protein
MILYASALGLKQVIGIYFFLCIIAHFLRQKPQKTGLSAPSPRKAPKALSCGLSAAIPCAPRAYCASRNLFFIMAVNADALGLKQNALTKDIPGAIVRSYDFLRFQWL